MLAKARKDGKSEQKQGEVENLFAVLDATPPPSRALPRLALPDVQQLVEKVPSADVLRWDKRLDFYTPPLNRHTRNGVVVGAVNGAFAGANLPATGAPQRASAITMANSLMHYGGSDRGWAERVSTKINPLMASLPDFDGEVSEEHLNVATKYFPLNKVTSVILLREDYKPNMHSSRGLPHPSRSKQDDSDAIIDFMMELEETRDVTSLTNVSHWKTAVIKLKSELHSVDKLHTKARGYFVLPAETSLVLGSFLAAFYHGAPNFLEKEDCLSMVGASFYHGGAERLLRWVDSVAQTTAAFYADDGLMVIVTPTGRKWVCNVDVSSMDMNTPGRFKTGWLEYLALSVAAMDEKEQFWIEDLLNAYQALLTSAEFALPRGVIVSWDDFAPTGFPGNTHYETYVCIVMWKTVVEPYLADKIAGLDPDLTGEAEEAALHKILAKAVKKTARFGPWWKEEYELSFYDGTKLHNVLGHTVWRPAPEKPALAAVPLGRLLASLLNPRTKPSTSGSAVVLAYMRSIALLISGGYAFDVWWQIVRVLGERSKEVLAGMNPDHIVVFVEAAVESELNEVEKLRVAHLVRVHQGRLQLRKPPSRKACRRLRTKAKARSVQSLIDGSEWADLKERPQATEQASVPAKRTRKARHYQPLKVKRPKGTSKPKGSSVPPARRKKPKPAQADQQGEAVQAPQPGDSSERKGINRRSVLSMLVRDTAKAEARAQKRAAKAEAKAVKRAAKEAAEKASKAERKAAKAAKKAAARTAKKGKG